MKIKAGNSIGQTLNLYAYIPNEDGRPPLGSEGNWIIRDLKTVKGAIRRIRTNPNWANTPFVIQTFTNFYDDRTFKTVYTNTPPRAFYCKPYNEDGFISEPCSSQCQTCKELDKK